jgi:hypothetical protein
LYKEEAFDELFSSKEDVEDNNQLLSLYKGCIGLNSQELMQTLGSMKFGYAKLR